MEALYSSYIMSKRELMKIKKNSRILESNLWSNGLNLYGLNSLLSPIINSVRDLEKVCIDLFGKGRFMINSLETTPQINNFTLYYTCVHISRMRLKLARMKRTSLYGVKFSLRYGSRRWRRQIQHLMFISGMMAAWTVYSCTHGSKVTFWIRF